MFGALTGPPASRVSCALTCRAWLPRSLFHIFRVMHLMSSRHITQLHNLLTLQPTHGNLVRELVYQFPRAPRRHHAATLSSFPFVLAGRLQTGLHCIRITQIRLVDSEEDIDMPTVPPRDKRTYLNAFHPTSLMVLEEFTSVTELVFEYVTFESYTGFVDLLCALPNLSILVLDYVDFLAANDSNSSLHGVQHRPKIVSLKLNKYPACLIEWMLDFQLLSQLTTLTLNLDIISPVYFLPLLQGVANSLHHLKFFLEEPFSIIPSVRARQYNMAERADVLSKLLSCNTSLKTLDLQTKHS
ncbi:hypothetical protein B0H21DRAFT_816768, partial [Amylocystis lapponica]